MDIALGVAACVDEVNFIENVNDDEDDDEECIVVAGVDNEVEQKWKHRFEDNKRFED